MGKKFNDLSKIRRWDGQKKRYGWRKLSPFSCGFWLEAADRPLWMAANMTGPLKLATIRKSFDLVCVNQTDCLRCPFLTEFVLTSMLPMLSDVEYLLCPHGSANPWPKLHWYHLYFRLSFDMDDGADGSISVLVHGQEALHHTTPRRERYADYTSRSYYY